MRNLTRSCLGAVAAAGLLSTSPAHAGSESFAGTFAFDDDLFATRFVLPADDLLAATTWSYGGGIDAAGSTVVAGGFAPVLALFAEGGGLIALAAGSAATCGAGSGRADPVSGFCWDARISLPLPAGSYTLVLSQDGNLPLGDSLADGYSMAGQPDYTGRNYLGLPGQHFIQVDGGERNGSWALDLSAAAVPELPPALLLCIGLAALATRRVRGAREPVRLRSGL